MSPSVANPVLERYDTTPVKTGIKLSELLKRPQLDYEKLKEIDTERPELTADIAEQAEIQIKYDGYIKRQEMQVQQFRKMEELVIPDDFDYDNVYGLRIEARQKLDKIRPHSIGQASRISGVSPADISVLIIYFKEFNRK